MEQACYFPCSNRFNAAFQDVKCFGVLDDQTMIPFQKIVPDLVCLTDICGEVQKSPGIRMWHTHLT